MKKLYLFSFLLTCLFSSLSAEEQNGTQPEEKFNAGKFIINHVTDKYEWHLWGPHENPVSIPLPLILYSKENGLEVFLSSKLDNPEGYKGYKFEAIKEGEKTEINKGKIIREDAATFYDFSITKAVTALLISCVLVLSIFISVAKTYTRRQGMAPSGFQGLLEPLILFVRDDIAKPSIGEKHYKRFLPFLLSIFSLSGSAILLDLYLLSPGIMGNISVTFTLAAIVLIITLVIGNKHYWKHIIWMPGVPAWVKIFLLTPIELIGVIQRPFVLMIRIFANVAAGHIVILSFVCLIFVFSSSSAAGGWGFAPVSMAFALFMNAMELLVAFLQAFVFTLLTAMYIGACVEEAPHEEHVAFLD